VRYGRRRKIAGAGGSGMLRGEKHQTVDFEKAKLKFVTITDNVGTDRQRDDGVLTSTLLTTRSRKPTQ